MITLSLKQLRPRAAARWCQPRFFCAAANAEVVRSSQAGVLVLPAARTGDPKQESLGRGSVVGHGGNDYVCVFQVDKFWFATPLTAAKTTARWVGKSGEDSKATDPVKEVVRSLKRPTPTQQQRLPLAEGIPTGLMAVDTLAPLGRGQSLLVCGPHGSGKSMLAREILEQVLTTKQVDKAIRFRLEPATPLVSAPVQSAGAFLEMAATAEAVKETPATLLTAFFSAVAEAERVRDSGRHALLVLDTVAPLLDAWRLAHGWAEEELGQPIETDVVGAQRRGCFSSLLERAASLSPSATVVGREGSLTLLVLAETEAMAALNTAKAGGKVSTQSSVRTYSLEDFADRREKEQTRLKNLVDRGVALTDASLGALGIAPPKGGEPSPEDRNKMEEAAAMRELQSLSDGQVVLDGAAAKRGEYPALACGATFSRFGLGSSTTAEGAEPRKHRDVRPAALQAVAAHLRTELALERDAGFRPTHTEGQTAAESVDSAQSARMAAVTASLLQPPRTPMLPEEMAAILLSACSGGLDPLAREEAAKVLRGGSEGLLLKHLREAAPQVLERIAKEQKLSVEAAKELEIAVRLFVALRK
eukprot:CAMPEP_0206451350 /NCGR_PEP_ID=MMETSP0324_2-20121206/19286_1 /ASSEMBLY_ACC=CAM_ASM_000836 /TAXON_ID=2866 /ORGANISM="Crypthecodinium cohnii, Strain Seligo" /LENGTH=587 /DNA_ID=CAMNT_0053921209 /DNA_START=88 /DNA_END=1848 /DNA_ORIENTATION=+